MQTKKEKKLRKNKKIKEKLMIVELKIKGNLKKFTDGAIFRKLKEVYIVSKSFCKALVDIFTIKSSDETYVSLAPTKNADKDGTYCNALKYAIDNSNIKNIAITGNYGSGKSSIIQSFFYKLENKKYNPIYVSLAAFNKNDYIEKSRETTGDKKVIEIQSKNEFYHTLEKSILQQLLYQASEREVPLSRFKRISKHSKLLLNIMTIGMIFAISILVCIIYPEVIDNIKNNYNSVKTNLSDFGTNILIAILMASIYIITYKILFFLITKFNISKFKIKDAEVEIDNKPESIFNKYLDEIIYFFQVTKHNVVIIEDLDRYEGNASFIFQKLRELNTLINSSNQVKYEVDFIYAIKDDFFEDYEERTKFFDYIIPVIPISSSGNSNEIMWKRLEKLKMSGIINYKFDKTFIDDISILIEDKRLIDNIINEFIIYKNKMHNELMDDKQLFAIIMYKNILPKEYSELQRDRGNIVNIFANKKDIVKSLIKDLQVQIDEISKEKGIIKNEYLNSIKELKYVLISNIYNYNNYPGYERHFEFNGEKVSINEFLNSNISVDRISNENIHFKIRSYGIDLDENDVFKYFGNKVIFIRRMENIEKGKDKILTELQNEIEEIEQKIENISKLSLKQLANKYDISSLFDNTKLIEKVFISKGYITEEYRDYITLFVAGNLTKEDNEFVFAVKTGEKLSYDFKLENIENILKKLNENDYETNAILNFDLLNYLIKNNYSKETLKVIKLLDKENEKILQFIDQFIEKYDCGAGFIKILIENSNKIWKKIYSKLGNKEYIDKWVIYFLTNENSLKNVDENFNTYIKEHEDIDKYITDEQISTVINSLKTLKIKLTNIKNIENKKFIEQIYLNELYELNTTMIKLMLLMKEVEQSKFKEKSLTIILTDIKLNNLKGYLLNEFDEYYNSCYTLNDSNEDEEAVILEIIQNENIDIDIRKQIIKNEKFNNYNIENIDRELIDTIIDNDKLKVSYDNILALLIKDKELKDNVIANISSHIDEYKLDKPDNHIEKYSLETIENFKKLYIFNKKVDIKDFKILVSTFDIKIVEIEECEKEKIEYLIDKKVIEFNVANFEYIKENIEEKLVKFIEINITDFIENIDEYDIIGYEDKLLNSDEINNESKKEIINHIEIDNLQNTTIVKLISNDMLFIDYKEINIRVLNDSSILLDDRLNLLKIILSNIDDKDEGTEYIHLFGSGYIDINTSKNACSILYSNSNIGLCNVLKEKSYISSYKIGKKKNIIIYNKVNR